MAKYRKIDPRIWNDAKFGSLCDHGKLVFMFLLTHPHMTSLGAMRASIPGLAAELGWSEKAFREAFRKACDKGMAKHDPKASLVWLPKFIRYNPPESPNVLKAWAGAVDMIPECPMKTEVLHSVKDFAEGLSKAFLEGLPEAFAKAMPNQEQEQEQEQEKTPTSPQPPDDDLVSDSDRMRTGCGQDADSVMDQAFELFWSSGMRKVNKKQSRQAFVASVKRERAEPMAFAETLRDDVKRRLAAGQMGFDAMHPTTYLRNERWHDEMPKANLHPVSRHTNLQPPSTEGLIDRGDGTYEF